jgi:hypothetical protein
MCRAPHDTKQSVVNGGGTIDVPQPKEKAMTRLLTTTAVLLAIVAVGPAQAGNSLAVNGATVNGVDANGPAIENDGAVATALLCCPRPR